MDLANRSNYFIFIETCTFAIWCSHNSGQELRPKKIFSNIEWHNSDIEWEQIWDTENLYESTVFSFASKKNNNVIYLKDVRNYQTASGGKIQRETPQKVFSRQAYEIKTISHWNLQELKNIIPTPTNSHWICICCEVFRNLIGFQYIELNFRKLLKHSPLRSIQNANDSLPVSGKYVWVTCWC